MMKMQQSAPEHHPLTTGELRQLADLMLADVPDGERLDPVWSALIRLGVVVSVTSLDRSAIEAVIDHALSAGASIGQAQEVISLVSGLGVHSLMVSLPALAARAKGQGAIDGPLDPQRQALWNDHVGHDPFWIAFEEEMPGFLAAMLRLSPDQFTAFFDYCAVPWRSGTVRAQCKELIGLASDATPTQRFLPGFRLHLRNAVALGAGKLAVLEAIEIAAGAPPHQGTR